VGGVGSRLLLSPPPGWVAFPVGEEEGESERGGPGCDSRVHVATGRHGQAPHRAVHGVLRAGSDGPSGVAGCARAFSYFSFGGARVGRPSVWVSWRGGRGRWTWPTASASASGKQEERVTV